MNNINVNDNNNNNGSVISDASDRPTRTGPMKGSTPKGAIGPLGIFVYVLVFVFEILLVIKTLGVFFIVDPLLLRWKHKGNGICPLALLQLVR